MPKNFGNDGKCGNVENVRKSDKFFEIKAFSTILLSLSGGLRNRRMV